MEPPSSAHHLDALTGVRAFAALWVFAFHSWSYSGFPLLRLSTSARSVDLTPLVTFGWLGLDVFFILSGFLLTRQACLKVSARNSAGTPHGFTSAFGEKYTQYLRRRVLRVYPAYYACLTALLLLAATGIYLRLPEKLELLLHLGMAHNFIEKYIATMNGVFWTLPFEWQFYLVFPLLFVLLRRYGAWALYGAALVSVISSKLLVMALQDGYPQVLLFIRLDEFAAGMCAGAYAFQRPPTRLTAATVFWAGLIGLLATPWIFAGYTQVGHYYDIKGFLRPPWIQLSICLMLLGLTGKKHIGVRIFDNKVAVGLGLISYSIYLYHVPVLELLPTLGLIPQHTAASQIGWPRILVSAFIVVVLVSALSYRFVERPFQESGKVPVGQSQSRGRGRIWFSVDPTVLLFVWAAALELFLFVRAR
jgi:peptidoglycan/LPS O-acetylase OafA/YrhL